MKKIQKKIKIKNKNQITIKSKIYKNSQSIVSIALCLLLLASNFSICVDNNQTSEYILVQNSRYTESPQVDTLNYVCSSNSVTLSRTQFPSNTVLISTKILNRIVKARNGNRCNSNRLKVIHWNAGSRLWENKTTEIESLMQQLKPDLCYISEANLWDSVDDMDRTIPNYKLLLPNTMSNLKHARIALLVKNEITVQQINYANEEAAVIWVKVGSTKKNSIIVGGGLQTAPHPRQELPKF